MNISQLIELVREIFNRKDDTTKRIAALLVLVYFVMQLPQVHDAVIAFAATHHGSIEGGIVAALIALLAKNPDKSTIAAIETKDVVQSQEGQSAKP